MRNLLVISFALFLAIFSMITMRTSANLISAQTVTKEQQIEQLNEQIKVLQDQKIGYEGRALYNENKAQRLQFVDGEQSTARKHWQLADAKRSMAAKIDIKLKELQQQRDALLKGMGKEPILQQSGN